MVMKDVQPVISAISSPPQITRLASCHDDFNNNLILHSLFYLEEEAAPKNTQRFVGGRGEGRGRDDGTLFQSSLEPYPLPMSYEQEADDEEACIGGCYYKMMDGYGGVSSSTAVSNASSSSTHMCKRLYPFPFVLLMCLLFLFGIGEMLRKVSSIHHDGVE